MGVVPKKALGQNFLVSRHVIEKIIQTVCTSEWGRVVELGPGLGALTEPLLKAGLTPLLLEMDNQLVEYWRGRGLEVIEGDAIQLNWDDLKLPSNTLLVSNLPYQISTHLVVDRCFGPLNLAVMVLMFQKEVAERLLAVPRTKEYGFLSIMTQLHFRMTRVTDAAPGDFFPPPKIASRVLRFERRSGVFLGPRFLRFVKHGFAFRRKFLLKNLKSVVDKAKLGLLSEAARELGYSEKVRAEEVSPDHFVELYKKVYEH